MVQQNDEVFTHMKLYQKNSNKKKAVITILISVKVDFKAKNTLNGIIT